MIPSREDIINLIPPPRGSDKKLIEIQNTDDIILAVYDAVKTSEGYSMNASGDWIRGAHSNYVKDFAWLFLEGNYRDEGDRRIASVDGVCCDIWEFMQNEWPYDPDMAETEDRQEARTIRAIVYDLFPEYFDCKHYATFAYSVLRALNIPCTLKLTSYDMINPFPSHIYVVAGVGEYDPVTNKFEQEFVIDGTMPGYNEESKRGVTQRYSVKIEH